jgi:hypothetical protein
MSEFDLCCCGDIRRLHLYGAKNCCATHNGIYCDCIYFRLRNSENLEALKNVNAARSRRLKSSQATWEAKGGR